MRIGVISDTHDYLDPRVHGLFAGVDHILHAGDIGKPNLLRELERIAPVTAVGGNTDDPAFRYPLVEVVDLGGVRFLLCHIVNPQAPGPTWGERFRRDHPAVVVFGHTHKPFCEKVGGTLFFNPGYAGKTRFGLERTLGLLRIEGGLAHEFISL